MKTPRIKAPRMTDWLLVTLALLVIIHQIKPELLAVDIHKLSLITMAGFIGYWLDRSIFYYARPDSFMAQPSSVGGPFVPDRAVAPTQQIVFAAAMLRRAIIVGCAMLAVSLGL